MKGDTQAVDSGPTCLSFLSRIREEENKTRTSVQCSGLLIVITTTTTIIITRHLIKARCANSDKATHRQTVREWVLETFTHSVVLLLFLSFYSLQLIFSGLQCCTSAGQMRLWLFVAVAAADVTISLAADS